MAWPPSIMAVVSPTKVAAPCKLLLINRLRKKAQQMHLQGFFGNLIGSERFIYFLCCENRENSEIDAYLQSIADAFKLCVHTQSPYTISLCISGRCKRLSEYSQMFPRMVYALSESYFHGKEFVMFLDHFRNREKAANQRISLDSYYPEVLSATIQQDREQLEAVLQKISVELIKSRKSPFEAQLAIIRLIQHIELCGITVGVPENVLLGYYESAVSEILATRFIADTCACFREYCKKVAQAIETHEENEESVFAALVKEYIAQHYEETLHLRDIAAAMNYSDGHFARVFRKTFGTTFILYLKSYRMEQSRVLLAQTHIPIEQIAYRVGYNSYSYFCTCFKQDCGISPGAYRASKSGESAME